METANGRWESGRRREAGRSQAARRKRKSGAALGATEKRRLGQLVLCILLFLVVFVGKGVFPERLDAVREGLLETIHTDTDFKAAFAQVGESVSRGEPMLDTLGTLWVDVFGGGTIPASDVSVSQSPLFRQEAERLISGVEEEEAVSAWAQLILPQRKEQTQEQPQQAQEAEPEPEAVAPPEAEPAVVHMEYDGPTLPDNATMDRYNLEVLGITETTTPALGWLSSPFGWRDHPIEGEERFHNGVDLAVNTGTPVLAFAAGTVDYIGDSPIYGLYLQLDHGNGLKTFYAHCSKLCVQQGQQIALGEKVAESGNTGNSTGPHLHFEMKLNGVLLNPLYYIETT